VELSLLDLEGELGGVVVSLKGLASQRNDLALLGVVLRQSVEELVLDLSALILLDVVGVDADRVVDVEVQRRTGVRSGSVAALLAARVPPTKARRPITGWWNIESAMPSSL